MIVDVPGNNTFFHSASLTAGTLVKSGYGTLHLVAVNSHGAGNTITLYDGLDTGGRVICVIDTVNQDEMIYDVAFNTGLFLVCAGGTPADFTIAYQ